MQFFLSVFKEIHFFIEIGYHIVILDKLFLNQTFFPGREIVFKLSLASSYGDLQEVKLDLFMFLF